MKRNPVKFDVFEHETLLEQWSSDRLFFSLVCFGKHLGVDTDPFTVHNKLRDLENIPVWWLGHTVAI